MPVVDEDFIDYLYAAHKVCEQPVEWQENTSAAHINHRFRRNLIVQDGGEIVEWIGYYQKNKACGARWGFKLEYRGKYCVRSWDMAPRHYCQRNEYYIDGVGRHKHFYLNEDYDRAVYEIPEGEISIDDPNQATIDFADECNIEMLAGYQQKIFP